MFIGEGYSSVVVQVAVFVDDYISVLFLSGRGILVFVVACVSAFTGEGYHTATVRKNKEDSKPQSVTCRTIRTMQDSEDRPQRRSAIVARELARLDVDFAVVSFAGQESHAKDGADHTLFCSGKNKIERRLSCVGLMIKTSIA